MQTLNTRQQQLRVLQKTFPTFDSFLRVSMKLLGFDTTPVQLDIGRYLEFGPTNLMIQAQRSQAKSTITAIFAVWYLIHNPQGNVLIISAGARQATEISTLIVRIIMNMPILECMRPDRTAGDKVSVEHFDLHYSIKGIDKSPSVACMGITANLQGARATLLIADDIESKKNSLTAAQREALLTLTKDFSSIVQDGRILYLGTPQSTLSIYNTLPGRGFSVRIWPGRYPTPTQMQDYGAHLAPMVATALRQDPSLASGGGLDGTSGKPIDPLLLGEELLRAKELDQGAEYFLLQHMLSTKLTDELRYPLKPERLIVMNLGERLPLHFARGIGPEHLIKKQFGSVQYSVSTAILLEGGFAARNGRVMFVDPAGGGANGDETGVAVVDCLNGNLFIRACTGIRGGYSEESMDALTALAVKYQPDKILIEKNLGYGAFTVVWLPSLRRAYPSASTEDVWSSAKKESRIIDTLEPVLGRGSLVVDSSVLEDDFASTSWAAEDKRAGYSFMFQLAHITRDSGALRHDDRLDALAGAVHYWLNALGIDSAQEVKSARDRELAKWMEDPMGYGRFNGPKSFNKSTIKRRSRVR